MKMNLKNDITELFRLTGIQKDALRRLEITTIEDLLYHFPVRYGDAVETKNIDALIHGENAVIFGRISGLKITKGFRTKVPMAQGYVEDETGRIPCVWFNQPYVAKMFHDGMLVRVEGKVSIRRKKKHVIQLATTIDGQDPKEQSEQTLQAIQTEKNTADRETGQLYLSNPKIEKVDKLPLGVGDSLFENTEDIHNLYPVYPESRGISSSWIYHNIQKIFKGGFLDQIEETIPQDILDKYHLPTIKTALIWIHAPQKQDDALSARKRFSFEEIFTIQLGKQQTRKEYDNNSFYAIETKIEHVREFVRRFPFQATEAQTKAVETIVRDMQSERVMTRLLEGDVGSGKTAVAAAAAYAVITAKVKDLPSARLSVAYMCPTEILAIQHFESFIKFFSYMPIQIGLLTSSGCRKFPSKVNPKGWTDISRSQLLKWVENGEISIVVGTHSLIQKSVRFKHLALAIIDEQHRFGTEQRAKLIKKSYSDLPDEELEILEKKTDTVPHLLTMTATPIPRTLALTMYGDLDLTLLDEVPAGRKQVITELILPSNRDETYEKVRKELQSGRQAFIICPRIEEPDPDKEIVLNAKSVKEEAKRLKKKVFPEYEIGVLHSKLSAKEKDDVMNRFKAGELHILCATSVVEVGVNVPNATVIIIEGAERFGLAQLHQLRGRVIRSSYQAYCYVFTETASKKSLDRLRALQSAKNGFELAEIDLTQRGSGTLSGKRQWGVSDIAMEALQNLKMVEAARTEALRMISEDKNLDKYPLLKEKVARHRTTSHFE